MNLKTTISCLIFFVVCAGGIAQDASQYMAQARQAQVYFDYNGALSLMNKALKLEPQNTDNLIERGNLQLLLEKFKKGKADFDAVLAIDSNDVFGWIGLADYFRYTDQLDTAMKCAEAAQILAASDIALAKAQLALADIYMAQGQDSTAAAHFIRSLEIDSTNVSALKKISYLLSEQGRYDEANSYLLKAYTYDRFDLEILVNLAYTFNRLEYFYEAIEYCNLALDLDPQHPITLSNRAYAYLNNGMESEALQDIKRSIANDASNPMAHRYAGEIYLSMKEKDKACKSFKQAEKYGYSKIYDDGKVASQVSQHCE